MNKAHRLETERVSARRLLVEALEADLERMGRVDAKLDRNLIAWAGWSKSGACVRLGYTSPLGALVRRNNRDNNVNDEPNHNIYDHGYLEWLDAQLMMLRPSENDLISQEAKHPKGRRNTMRWCIKWNRSQPSYSRARARARGILIDAIEAKHG